LEAATGSPPLWNIKGNFQHLQDFGPGADLVRQFQAFPQTPPLLQVNINGYKNQDIRLLATLDPQEQKKSFSVGSFC
jgi:hypothetical protein